MPVAGTPTNDASAAFSVTVDKTILKPGEYLVCDAYDLAHPSVSYSVEIRRRLAGEARNPATDPVADIQTTKLDTDGYTQFRWVPGQNVSFTGNAYRYYPVVINTEDTSRWAVPDDTEDTKVYNRLTSLLSSMDDYLGSVQDIHIYDLKSRDSNTYTRRDFSFTYGNWRQDKTPSVYLASDTGEYPQSGNYTIGNTKGVVTFNTDIGDYMDVYASFIFGLYGDNQLRTFLSESLREMNLTRPVTAYTLDDYPDHYEPYILAGATVKALHRMKADILFKEKLFLFSNASYVNQLESYINTLSERFTYAQQNKNRWGTTLIHGITGYDQIVPPRVTPGNYAVMAYMRGTAG